MYYRCVSIPWHYMTEPLTEISKKTIKMNYEICAFRNFFAKQYLIPEACNALRLTFRLSLIWIKQQLLIFYGGIFSLW